jgi:hypothetical protein
LSDLIAQWDKFGQEIQWRNLGQKLCEAKNSLKEVVCVLENAKKIYVFLLLIKVNILNFWWDLAPNCAAVILPT